jgi:hypothetical protein
VWAPSRSATGGRTVARAGAERFWLAADIDALPHGHSRKRLVAFMALYARAVLTGELPGPYTFERALAFALRRHPRPRRLTPCEHAFVTAA